MNVSIRGSSTKACHRHFVKNLIKRSTCEKGHHMSPLKLLIVTTITGIRQQPLLSVKALHQLGRTYRGRMRIQLTRC